jgi:hypothetical protein
MTAPTTKTTPQVNGDTTYSSKFLPKVTSIPVVNSLKKQLFTTVPQAESLTKFIGDGLSTAFSYTNDTPIQPILIKLDTLAASGVAKLEKEVPMVNTPTDEVLKKTKLDRFIGFFTHYYTVSFDFVFNVFDAYKGAFDKGFNSFLDRFESFFGIKGEGKPDSPSARVSHIRGALIEKVDSRITPLANQLKETTGSIYSNQIVPLSQYPLKQLGVVKEKASEIPIVSEIISRVTKAESAAESAWVETKPDISGPNAVIPTLKSGLFVVITFGYNLIYPEEKKPSPKGVQDQTNGLVSGVELHDGEAKKRPNGTAS